MPNRECPSLESTLAGTGLEGPGQLHLETQKIVVDGIFHADMMRSSKQGGALFLSRRYRGEPRDNFTSHRSRGARKVADEPATARGCDRIQHREKKSNPTQADDGETLIFAGGKIFRLLVFFLFVCCLCYAFCFLFVSFFQ